MKLDRLLAAMILVMLLPILIGVALLIRLIYPGPALVTEELQFNDSDDATCYRFRTRVNEAMGYRRTTDFLEAWSIDRLPGLWSVVRGNIGLRQFFDLVRGATSSG